MGNGEALAIGALWGSVHILRALVNRGLISPNEVDEIYGSMLEGIQQGDPSLAASLEAKLEGVFAELRQWAGERWIGRGETDPR